MATVPAARSPQTDIELASPTSPDVRSAKRQKVTRACDNCKTRKRRCTGEVPCKVCLDSGASCTYLASYTRGRLVQPQPNGHDHGWNSNMTTASSMRPTPNPHRVLNDDGNIRPSRTTSPDAGESNLTEGQYSGPTSSYTFLRRAWKRFSRENDGTSEVSRGLPDEPVPSNDMSIFAFGDRSAPQVDIESFRLPDRATGTSLVTQYFELAMPTYRFFHQQTVVQWLEAYYQREEAGTDEEILSPVRQAAVLIILANSCVFDVMNQEKQIPAIAERASHESERMFRVAQSKLQSERGRPKLESVQARLASVLYLLQVSRPNQAYYQFGTTIQLAISIGLHRASVNYIDQQDRISRECRKRTFWAASTLDTYLCVILGKPQLIHLDDVDQVLPDAIDDEDLTQTEGSVGGEPSRDSIIKASILHAQVGRIVKKALREQYSVHRKTADQKLASAARLNAEIQTWHDSIPIILSGAIHPSSLIPVFRRQVAVLKLAHSHARMLINRPSCLLDTTKVDVQQSQINECISAAKLTLDIVSAANLSRHNILWYTQFVIFNALSIVYVYLIERKPGNRLYSTTTEYDLEDLLRQAETVQKHLIEATYGNAPSLGYIIVLEELLQEVKRTCAGLVDEPSRANGAIHSLTSKNDGYRSHTSNESSSATFQDLASYPSDVMDAFANFPTDDDLWFALDSLPYSDYGQLG